VRAAKQAPARAGEGAERSLLAARLVLGGAFLAWSARAARQRHDPAAIRRVAGVLGARHLAQALLTAGHPARATLALGAEVDAVHSASMTALGLRSGRWRAAVLTDALLAGSLAAAGMACARSRPRGNAAGARYRAARALAGPARGRSSPLPGTFLAVGPEVTRCRPRRSITQ
jgi:hypothetical protein